MGLRRFVLNGKPELLQKYRQAATDGVWRKTEWGFSKEKKKKKKKQRRDGLFSPTAKGNQLQSE